ncbi:STS14 protein [Pistacia vera]|uniref:STS14 protein-like n=1 Tax=Pistacia vera TaxID=55513 RepID=UPI001262C599|nr:STS14 protein-like [Pistacia vera]XP_031270778.1 STS14 protein [Pistacia vera]
MAKPLLALLVLALFLPSVYGVVPVGSPTSSNSGTGVPDVAVTSVAKEFLEPHNQARAAVGVGALKWSENLANASGRLVRYQRNKMGCQFANLTNGKYGANQFWASGTTATPRMAVDTWVKEKNYYNHANNSCAPNHMCGVYTQVVWRKSLELGCAQATCAKEQVTLTICFYNPPGNYEGESPY